MVRAPSALTSAYIIDRWPRLYHMSEAGSWAAIRQHGLRSTSALLDLFGIRSTERDAIEAARRPESVPIHHAVYGTVWIRDNKPINESVLRRTLVGMSEAEWYRTLNGRVFFWLSRQRLERLRNAPPYRCRSHDVLELSTERLLAVHGDIVELSPLNSGAVHPAANYPRGGDTFRRIRDYPWTERLRIAPAEPIVELTVPYMLEDPEQFVIRVSTI